MRRAEESRTDEVRPDDVPLDVALEVCAQYGVSFEREGTDTPWRIVFLAELRRTACLEEAMKTVRLSQSALDGEMNRSRLFQAAVDMAIGRTSWDDAVWEEAVAAARVNDEV
jgi:hypothetical protein